MKIFTAASSRCHWCQIDRIEKDFIQLGHEITSYPQEADLIYQNNPPFDQIIEDKLNNIFKKDSKIIFNILDIPIHLKNYDVNKIINQLKYADAITSISKYTLDCVKKYCNYDSDVIYQPIMPIKNSFINYDNSKLFNYKFLICGRINDPNKRFDLVIDSLVKLGCKDTDLAVCGPDKPYFGIYQGILREDYLNDLFNSVEYVFMTSMIEGIGLPLIETLAANKIPIICNDLTTREEFLPSNMFPEYNDVYPTVESLSKFINSLENNFYFKSTLKNQLFSYYKDNLEYNFSPRGVAEKIINIYNKL